MYWIDYTIAFGVVAGVTILALWTRRFTKSVADFLAANRCAGKYLLAVGDGMAGLGAISIVAQFQMMIEGGFTSQWWQSTVTAATGLVAISGWVIYRFRRTRALTLAQFVEMRYSRRLRVFTGLLAFVSGIVNFGIFPSVGARFFVYFCGLPAEVTFLGWSVSSYALVMTCLLAISVFYTWVGGQIAVLVTDFAQGCLCNITFVVITFYLLFQFNWSDISATLVARPAGQSMVDPFDISGLENYDFFYYLAAIVGLLYGAYSWQGQQGYNTSARNAHHARMSKILGYMRFISPMSALLLMSLVAYAVLHGNMDFPAKEAAETAVGSISNAQIQKQMTVPIAMSYVLPPGIAGLLCAVMFAAFVTTHDTYLHSWGSIFVQDILVPLRGRPLSKSGQLWALRSSIAGVAVYSWLFSYYFVHRADILMFFALSGSIFLSGSGALIVGGLYWRRGTTAGGWTAMALSVITSAISIVLVMRWPEFSGWVARSWPGLWGQLTARMPALEQDTFILTAQELAFFSWILCGTSYVVVSLLTSKKSFNLDRMLHRGAYAIEGEEVPEEKATRSWWKRITGFGPEVKWDDKCIFVFSYGYVFCNFAVVGLGTLYCLFYDVSDETWVSFWYGYIWFLAILTTILTLWLGIGGVIDLRDMFARLKTAVRDDSDDGRVIEESPEERSPVDGA